MNRIIVKNLKIFAYHGVHDFEKKDGQDFFIDAVVEFPKPEKPINDNIDNVVSYSKIIEVIKRSVTEKSYDLIETVADRVASELLFFFGEIISAEVTVKKPNAPIKEEFDYVAVQISKKREEI